MLTGAGSPPLGGKMMSWIYMPIQISSALLHWTTRANLLCQIIPIQDSDGTSNAAARNNNAAHVLE